MSTNPFVGRELAEPGLLDRLIGREPKKNAFLELNNLISSKPIQEIELEERDEIEDDYSIDLREEFARELDEMYERYVRFVIEDKELDEEEAENLKSLKHLLGLTDMRARSIYNDVVSHVYQDQLDKAVEDGLLDSEEKEELEKLRDRIALPEDVADRLFAEAAKARVQKAYEDAVSDERLSPDEEKELQAIGRSLNVDVQMDHETKKALEKFRLLWLIENDEIPTIDPGINLQRNEECYFAADVNWHEYRKERRRIRYGGPTARVRIAKGVYWRAGDLGIKSVSEDVLKLIDNGRMFLTNKRIIFMGSRGNKNIRLPRILSFEPYQNGVQIQKDAGKSPFLEFTKGVDVFASLLQRAINDATS